MEEGCNTVYRMHIEWENKDAIHIADKALTCFLRSFLYFHISVAVSI